MTSDALQVLIDHNRREGYVLRFLLGVVIALFVMKLCHFVRDTNKGRQKDAQP